MSLETVEPVEVRIRDLSVSVTAKRSWFELATYRSPALAKSSSPQCAKQLLYSINADMPAGSLTAIIGGSGSGKTTFLDTVAERLPTQRLNKGGVVTFNGNRGIQNASHAYVMQQDILLPTLTVRETLQYSANLRLSSSPADFSCRVVETVIQELGLHKCANTRIGDNKTRGCSGGERRRVSIGVQLLANPSILFLDEPTTGLDSASALQIIRLLKVMAQKGRTIIMTIHQPRLDMWALFDSIIVLSKGHTLYSGLMSNCLPWFEAQGFRLPLYVNPTDFIIDLATIDLRAPYLEKESTSRVDTLRTAWQTESARRFAVWPIYLAADQEGGTKVYLTGSFLHQVWILTGRTLRVTYRDPLGVAASIIEAVLMGIAAGYLFYNLGRDQSGIRSRQGGLYVAAGLQGYLILIFEVYRLSLDVATFDKEFAENCVTAPAFVLSRRLARLPEDISVPLIFSALVYFMAGFERKVDRFFIFFTITLANHYIAVTCAMACVVISRPFAGASLIANSVYTLQTMACGMCIQSKTFPAYVQWLKWITYTYYTFGAYIGNEFGGAFYDCPYSSDHEHPACTQFVGEYIIASLGFSQNWVRYYVLIMVAFVVFFLFFSILGFHFFKIDKVIARSPVHIDLSFESLTALTKPIMGGEAITIGLHRFGLTLRVRSFFGGDKTAKSILSPITANVQPGVLNVILGPSGSGKTSLLNAMALRCRNSIGSNYYDTLGELTFNGVQPSDSTIRSVCCYVGQNDDSLLPSLTVRETLQYAAALRLPSHMDAQEKHRRAEDILIRLGLKDCANNLIGNHLIKGISGGEKRRVTIAIQILTDPRILLIDEPTSGLDAFAAKSTMEVLLGLAEEGRTILLSIHQPRSELFDMFGNILLLASGGFPVYFGAGKDMLRYFHHCGYDCPIYSNPADFALDTVTSEGSRKTKEGDRPDRVQKLIELWARRADDAAIGSKCLPHEDKTTAPKEERQRRINSVSETRDNFTHAQLVALIRTRTPLRTALPILLRRIILTTRRQPQLVLARTMPILGFAAILTIFLAPLSNDYYSVQNRMGFIQQIGAFYFIGMLQNVSVYPNERDIFYREDDDKVYSITAFLAAYTIIEVPFEIISSLFFGLLAVLAVKLPRSGSMFAAATFACFSGISCGESVGIMFNTLFNHTGFAVNTMGVVLAIANAMAGVLSINMPALFRAFNYVSPIRYATCAVATYSLRDVDFMCTSQQLLQDESCPITSGNQVLELYSLDNNPKISLVGMALCTAIYRLLAWLLLLLIRGNWRHGNNVRAIGRVND